MTKFGLGIRHWNDLDNIIDNLGGHRTLINDLNFITAGYDKLAIQTATREEGREPIGNFRRTFHGQ